MSPRRRILAAYDRIAGRLDRTRTGRFVLDLSRGALTVLHHLQSEPVFEHAAALSYATILALVPLLAVSLSIASAAGHDVLRDRVRDFAFAFLAPGIRQSSMTVLESFIDRATSGGVISISGVALFFSALMLLRNIEVAFNKIWGVPANRSWPRRVAIYVVVLLFGPVLLGASLALGTWLSAAIEGRGLRALGWVAVGPFLVAVTALTILYKMAPNARVQKRAAFAGALVAGVAFNVVKHGYAVYVAHAVSYSVIYGSLAALPLFLVWLYITWVVVLYGARLAYAMQHAGSWGPGALPRSEGMRARLSTRTLLAAAVAQVRGWPAPGIHTIARRSGLSEAAVAESARLLAEAGLLTQDVHGGLVPSRPLADITLADVAAASRGGSEPGVLGTDPASRAVASFFAGAEQGTAQNLARLDLRALATSLVEPAAPSAPERGAAPASSFAKP